MSDNEATPSFVTAIRMRDGHTLTGRDLLTLLERLSCFKNLTAWFDVDQDEIVLSEDYFDDQDKVTLADGPDDGERDI